jgi:hypothetical protein
MTPDAASSPHSLATASGLLFGALGLAMGVGALVGWAFGAPELGLLVGALAGIPLGVVAVYYVHTRAEPQTTAGHVRPLQTQNGSGDAERAREAVPLRAKNDDEDSW